MDPADVVVVSENPEDLVRAYDVIRDHGGRAVGCIGPVRGRCELDDHRTCFLAERAPVAIVVSPPAGIFEYGWRSITAGEYAARLARAHPDTLVILCNAPEGEAGPTGEVTVAADFDEALGVVARLVARSAASRDEGARAPA